MSVKTTSFFCVAQSWIHPVARTLARRVTPGIAARLARSPAGCACASPRALPTAPTPVVPAEARGTMNNSKLSAVEPGPRCQSHCSDNETDVASPCFLNWPLGPALGPRDIRTRLGMDDWPPGRGRELQGPRTE
ncbi:unnamed protein product [Prorocentrum cordatum]|uniref:Uncharacterized protein n=1 Tax=Prorocentrum cordatum TaxID=2364126 RepID=A0ABN9SLA3_9DINO|nr:unnamed protein product [Polarella glacialis]